MQQERRSPSPAVDRHRPSVKALLSSANPPASPLDALVMALEATVEEEKRRSTQGWTLAEGAATEDKQEEDDDDDDPDATIPSSPTMFMKRPATGPSLHHLPTMMLPESAASSAHSGRSSGLTPSTLPEASSSSRISQRKLSISSQGSSSSSSTHSGSERTKEYACTIGTCEKKFYQVAHLRSHERCIANLSAIGDCASSELGQREQTQ
ncbi:hypothetical protein BGX31_002807 [Mortierella sp. GBA43]|nr:hypothetical protein BGX31_002807 [Mortierella sp. GBA43]